MNSRLTNWLLLIVGVGLFGNLFYLALKPASPSLQRIAAAPTQIHTLAPTARPTPRPTPIPTLTPRQKRRLRAEARRKAREEKRRLAELARQQKEQEVEESARQQREQAASEQRDHIAARDDGIVSFSEYNQLRNGMTYSQVAEIIGYGKEISSNSIAGYYTVMYEWQNPDGSNMNAMFQNDSMMQKAQFGLQ